MTKSTIRPPIVGQRTMTALTGAPVGEIPLKLNGGDGVLTSVTTVPLKVATGGPATKITLIVHV